MVIKKIGALIINYQSYSLTIQSLQEEDKPLESYEISQETQQWIETKGSITNQLEVNISQDDIEDYSKRNGIWVFNTPTSFFSNVSIFENIPYMFKFSIREKHLADEDHQNNDYTEKNYSDQENLINLRVSSKNFDEILALFFENPNLWMNSIETQEIDGVWIVNFKEYTGRLKIKNEIIKKRINDIEVIPRKITRETYALMLTRLNSFLGNIFFKYKTPTELLASLEYIPIKLEQLELYDYPIYLLLDNIMFEISVYFSGLKSQLNTTFFYLDEVIESHKLEDFSNINYIQTISNPTNLYLINIDNTNHKIKRNKLLFEFYSTLISFRNFVITNKKLSYDTKENRFIKYVLNLLLFELDRTQIQNIFYEFNKSFLIEEYRSNLAEKIHYLERLEVKDLHRIPYNSQLLQKNSYYRVFFQYFMWLQNPTIFNIDNLFFIDSKPMDRLYEYYCFSIMKEALDAIVYEDNLLSYPIEINEHVNIIENPEITKYRSIKCIIFKYNSKDDKDVLLIYKPYNHQLFRGPNSPLKTYSGKKSRQEPDFLLAKIDGEEICTNNKKNLMIVFDAKYRKESGDLWHTMHFYKDALNALGAVFINPFISEEDKHYSGKLFTPYGELSNKESLEEIEKEHGFISGINLLGLKNVGDEIENFKNLFKVILKHYFL